MKRKNVVVNHRTRWLENNIWWWYGNLYNTTRL